MSKSLGVDDDLSKDDVRKLLSVFETQGLVSTSGGIARFRTLDDIRRNADMTSEAIDNALARAREDTEEKTNRPGLSAESRALMQEILRKQTLAHEDIGSRVTALLAGTSLTTTAGARKTSRREDIEPIAYEAYSADSSKRSESSAGRSRGMIDETFNIPTRRSGSPYEANSRGTSGGARASRSASRGPSMPVLPPTLSGTLGVYQPGYGGRDHTDGASAYGGVAGGTVYTGSSSTAAGVYGSLRRRSVKRHANMSKRVSRMETDPMNPVREETPKRIVGLRRAKVPLMVYSCGGFTRCFRIARIYDADGPPIGVKYDELNKNGNDQEV